MNELEELIRELEQLPLPEGETTRNDMVLFDG